MILQLCEKQAEMQAKKERQENIKNICDLDDKCVMIDDLMKGLKDSCFEFKDKFIEDLKDWKFDIVAEMRYYENENLENDERMEKL